MLEFVGTYIPIPTPFTDDGASLSEVRLARWLRATLPYGFAGAVVGSDAGEFAAMNLQERGSLFELAGRALPSDMAMIAHITCLGTAGTMDLAQRAANAGARAAVLSAPYYGNLSDAELLSFFRSVCSFARIPVILVDPQRRIDPLFLKEVQDVQGLHVASPVRDTDHREAACFDRATTDEFAVGELYCLPMAIFGIAGFDPSSSATFRALQEIIHIFGVARVLKSTQELFGTELGPLRPPIQSVPAAKFDMLEQILRAA